MRDGEGAEEPEPDPRRAATRSILKSRRLRRNLHLQARSSKQLGRALSSAGTSQPARAENDLDAAVAKIVEESAQSRRSCCL